MRYGQGCLKLFKVLPELCPRLYRNMSNRHMIPCVMHAVMSIASSMPSLVVHGPGHANCCFASSWSLAVPSLVHVARARDDSSGLYALVTARTQPAEWQGYFRANGLRCRCMKPLKPGLRQHKTTPTTGTPGVTPYLTIFSRASLALYLDAHCVGVMTG